MPLQLILLSYFATCMVYVNFLQAVIYKKTAETKTGNSIFTIESSIPEVDDFATTEHEMTELSEKEADTYSVQTDISATTECDRAYLIIDRRKKRKSKLQFKIPHIALPSLSRRNCIECCLVLYISVGFIMMAYTLVWNTGQIFYIFCPAGVFVMITFSYTYFHVI